MRYNVIPLTYWLKSSPPAVRSHKQTPMPCAQCGQWVESPEWLLVKKRALIARGTMVAFYWAEDPNSLWVTYCQPSCRWTKLIREIERTLGKWQHPSLRRDLLSIRDAANRARGANRIHGRATRAFLGLHVAKLHLILFMLGLLLLSSMAELTANS